MIGAIVASLSILKLIACIWPSRRAVPHSASIAHLEQWCFYLAGLQFVTSTFQQRRSRWISLGETALAKMWDNCTVRSSTYFKPKIWADGCFNSLSWVEELISREVLLSAAHLTHGTVCSRKEENDRFLKAIVHSHMTSLKACIRTKDLNEGNRVHANIRHSGLLAEDNNLGNMLVNMYAKCGDFTTALQVLDELPVRDVVSWNALIAGYAKHRQSKKAMECFRMMRSEGLSPNAVTYACILKACAAKQDADLGKKIHDEIVSQRLLEGNAVLGTALLDMYAKCGALAKAQEVLEELPVCDVVSWNALIAGYVQHGHGEEAMCCLRKMQSKGLGPDATTYSCILKACGIMLDAYMGEQMHDEIVSKGLLVRDVILGTALIDMYVKCGALTKAQEVLDQLPIRDVVLWNAVIAGYIQHEQGEVAVRCFKRMRSEGIFPDTITYACILKACGITLEAEEGNLIHNEIASQGLLQKNVVLGNALVNMYAKRGVLAKAQSILDQLPLRDVVTWNALIAGYAQNGQCKEALDCFKQMQIEGISRDVISWSALIGGYAQKGLVQEALDCFKEMQGEGLSPNAITFVHVLNACSHAGLVDEGQTFFEYMMGRFGIAPMKEHQTCMVDLFGRTRHFDKAMGVIKQMPFSDYTPVWSALLGACQKWGNVELGKLAFERVIQLDGHNVAAYVLMANIYTRAGMQEDARHIERLGGKNCYLEAAQHSCWTTESVFAHSCAV